MVLIKVTMANLRFMAWFKLERFLRFLTLWDLDFCWFLFYLIFNPVQFCHNSTYLAELALRFFTYSVSLNVSCLACHVESSWLLQSKSQSNQTSQCHDKCPHWLVSLSLSYYRDRVEADILSCLASKWSLF